VWFICFLGVVLATLATILEFQDRSSESPILGLAQTLSWLAFPVVGALILWRRPENIIGWIFCVAGLFGAMLFFGERYAIHALVTEPGSLPGGVAVAGVLQWGLYAPPVALMGIILPLLFPDGRLPSRRWRPVPWFAAAFVVCAMTYNGLSPGPIELGSSTVVDNPTGIEGAEPVLNIVGAAGGLCALAAAGAAVTSVIMRFRRARGVQRQQLKWFTYAAALVVMVTFASDFFPALQGPAVAFAFPLIPIAACIAILKYRLYDIDVIINRTLVYGALTAFLTVSYLIVVTILQQLFRPLTGDSGPAVAASTLAVAAMFRPALARVQAFIDRRFYRARYDAARTVEAFSARLRDEVDIDSLTDDLLGVVQESMQPRSMLLWLRADSFDHPVTAAHG
jgi:hypothetical protein